MVLLNLNATLAYWIGRKIIDQDWKGAVFPNDWMWKRKMAHLLREEEANRDWDSSNSSRVDPGNKGEKRDQSVSAPR